MVRDVGSKHQHAIRVLSEYNEVSGLQLGGATCWILETGVDGSKNSTFLSFFGSPIIKRGRDVK
eukprot:10391396-Heterocapsa_arctica.AAC.1